MWDRGIRGVSDVEVDLERRLDLGISHVVQPGLWSTRVFCTHDVQGKLVTAGTLDVLTGVEHAVCKVTRQRYCNRVHNTGVTAGAATVGDVSVVDVIELDVGDVIDVDFRNVIDVDFGNVIDVDFGDVNDVDFGNVIDVDVGDV